MHKSSIEETECAHATRWYSVKLFNASAVPCAQVASRIKGCVGRGRRSLLHIPLRQAQDRSSNKIRETKSSISDARLSHHLSALFAACQALQRCRALASWVRRHLFTTISNVRTACAYRACSDAPKGNLNHWSCLVYVQPLPGVGQACSGWTHDHTCAHVSLP